MAGPLATQAVAVLTSSRRRSRSTSCSVTCQSPWSALGSVTSKLALSRSAMVTSVVAGVPSAPKV